ncbi:hypothetical protein NW768_004049 [Fusarium equiseti]|uniref:Uncharacterized protein n=1 Tax=Fusarium equiseti TaxID=61235 RepID=A0ABQ8RK37_FUSEQ|nr:hypothetical protein NW768_004049 [Fusarium equiseti]
MSWEGVSHMTAELFHSLGQLEVFRLPDVHDPPMCIVGQDSHGLVEWLNNLDKKIETRGINQEAMDLPHTVLSFEVERFDWPAEWKTGWMNQENFQEVTTSLHEDILPQVTGQVSRKRVLEPDVYTRAPTLIDAPGYFYVLPDARRRRLLLDVRGVEVVDIPVTCSKSEIDEQLSWVHRVRVPEGYEKMVIDPPESPGEGERRLRISNDQLGGFLAALTEFGSWPRSFFTLLTTASGPSRWAYYRRMKGNLEHQCLTEWADTTLGWRLSSSFDEKLFYKVLSIMGYDYQAALFVCLPSTSGLVAAAKVQLASLIVSQRSYLRSLPDCLRLQGQGKLDCAYRVGLFKEHGWNSTLTMALGAMKLVLAGSTPSYMDADIGSLGLGEYTEHIKRVQAKCKLLIDAFKNAHTPIVDVASFSCSEPSLMLEQYHEVLFHLGRAFVFQTTFTTWQYEEKMYTTQNPLSLRKSMFAQWIMDLRPWAQSDTEQPYKDTLGVYTRIRCVDDRSPPTLMDLTCLPATVVDRLNEYLRSQD